MRVMMQTPARLLLALLFSPALLAQCANQSWDSPWKTATPVENAKQFAALLPAGMQVRYAAGLWNHDTFVAYAANAPRSALHSKDQPQDGGFLFVRNGKVIAQQSLLGVAEWKKFARDVGPADKPAFSVFVTEFCSDEKPHIALGFSACCSDASAVLFFYVSPDRDGYKLASMPVVGGGRLQIFPGQQVSLREWSGKEDGKCEQCEQHFRITGFRVLNGTPVAYKAEDSEQMYKPGKFAPHRISLESAEK